MNIQGWNFDFESLPYWPDERDSYKIPPPQLYEYELSDLACIIYCIIENTMCNYVGSLAILRRKENPVLSLAIQSFIVPARQIIFSSSGNQIFLQVHVHDRSRRNYERPLLVLDIAQNRFSYVRGNLYAVDYHIEEVTPDVFSFVLNNPHSSNEQEIAFSKKTIDLHTLEWFPMKEIESLPAKYFAEEEYSPVQSPLLNIKREPSKSERKRPKRQAKVQRFFCVGCGVCLATCPTKAISMVCGIHAHIDRARCVGCGKCVTACSASVIQLKELAP